MLSLIRASLLPPIITWLVISQKKKKKKVRVCNVVWTPAREEKKMTMSTNVVSTRQDDDGRSVGLGNCSLR
jgi:hypothetical protein